MYRYIIIDDEELIRLGTIKKISPLNDRVTCAGQASNGREGLALIEKENPDFVILDMQMPVMDGMELLPAIRNQWPDLPLIVISGYKNFDYIKQAISANAVEYLLKPFSSEMIQQVILKIIDRFEKNSRMEEQIQLSEEQKEMARRDYDLSLLHNLIFGYHVADTTLTSHRLNYINSTHDLFLITVHFQSGADDASIPAWLENNGFGDMSIYISGEQQNTKEGFLIFFLPEQNSIQTRRLVGSLVERVRVFLFSDFPDPLIGVSDVHDSLDDLSQAYLESSLALDARKISDHENTVYFYNRDIRSEPYEWGREEEFLFRVEAGMTDKVALLTSELFHWYTEIDGCRILDVKNHCAALLSRCRSLIREYLDSQENNASSDSIENNTRHLCTLAEIEEYYTRFFRNLTAAMQMQNVYSDENVIENVKKYIQKNYARDLNQDFIASLFYLNRSYLSSLFRAQTGEKFKDYLSDIRISHAEELLGNENLKMYQIARAVGYDNPKYFFRIFKKRTGMTPEEYRTHLGEDNS